MGREWLQCARHARGEIYIHQSAILSVGISVLYPLSHQIGRGYRAYNGVPAAIGKRESPLFMVGDLKKP